MFVELIKTSGLLTLPILSMVFFMLVFALALLWTVTRKQQHYSNLANLPLQEDQE